jgi:FtsP/CotA-like multicopper oxidase with cupredoxin domain
MLTRRAFMYGSAAAALATPIKTLAQTTAPAPDARPASSDTTILRLIRRNIEVNGKSASVYGIRQPNGTYGYTASLNDRFRVRVENEIGEPSLIHWHGLTPPWQQDGVPGVSGPPIQAGGNADYDFPLPFGGTFWMHSHQGLQEQLLMSAPLIIHDQRNRRDQEIVLMLSDFSFTPPQEIFDRLKQKRQVAGTPATAPAVQKTGMTPTQQMVMPMAAGAMRPGAAAKPDLNDVKYDAFLANDRTLADPEVVKVEPGSRVLLRIINGSSMSAFHVDLGNLDGVLVAVDGMRTLPIAGRRFPIAVAQRLDIRLSLPRAPAAYPVLAVLEGETSRTGIILSAGGANIARIPDQAKVPSAPLNLDLESRLRAVDPLSPRKADRTHVVNLTGDMANYIWSLNNVAWTPETPPLPIAAGERVELVFVNKTMMSHPMHLHGHTFQVVEIDGRRISGARRDTVLVTPGRRVVVAFDADNPGLWAMHCHLLYHLDAGMFTTLRYV